MPHDVTSCPVTTRLAMSCHFMPCHVMSCHVMCGNRTPCKPEKKNLHDQHESTNTTVVPNPSYVCMIHSIPNPKDPVLPSSKAHPQRR